VGSRGMPPSPWIGLDQDARVSSSTMSRTTLVLLSGACFSRCGRAEAFEVLLVAGRGERVQQAAMESRLEADDLVPLGLAVHVLILADQLDAALDRLGARVAEETSFRRTTLLSALGELLAVADAEQVRVGGQSFAPCSARAG